jgi:hypothetical protein
MAALCIMLIERETRMAYDFKRDNIIDCANGTNTGTQ